MLALQYFVLISRKFEARLIFLSSVCSCQTFFFLMLLAPSNVLTLQRQTVFACPWVCCQALQSAVGMSFTCQNIFLTTVSSISFLLCLPKLSIRSRRSPTEHPLSLFSPVVFSFFHTAVCFLVSSSVMFPYESCSLLLNFQSQNPEWTLPSTILHTQCFSWPSLSLCCSFAKRHLFCHAFQRGAENT